MIRRLPSFFAEPAFFSSVRLRRASAALLAAALLAGCASPLPGAGESSSAADLAAAERRVPGVYEGTLPCSGCAGIRTALYVRAVGTYTRVSAYVGRDGAFEEAGSWRIDEADPAVVIFEPMDRADEVWKASLQDGGRLQFLDGDGKPLCGKEAGGCALRKP